MELEVADDGLVIPIVGRWAKRKYHFLRRYLDLFSTGMKFKWPERHYVDLFSSAGYARLGEGGEIVLSSAMLAAGVKDPFTQIHCCEAKPSLASALRERLGRVRDPASFRVLPGDANEQIDQLLDPIPTRGALTLVFVDPFGLHFDFATLEKIASRRCDLIILLADNMDAMRNWAAYYLNNPHSSLDRFLGESGWRDVFSQPSSDGIARRPRERYRDRLGSLGYDRFAFEPVKNTKGRDIYSLLFASTSPKGLEFWRKAAAKDEHGQQSIDFGD